MKYKVSQKRADLLDDNFFEFSFNKKKPDKELFDSLTEPVELHYIADKYNWDDGPEVLNWIVNSPVCDKGTAKLIFWRSQPDHYTHFENAKEAEYDADIYLLLKNIIANFENGFYKTEKIFYDPRQDSGAPDVDYKDPNSKWNIPEYLKIKGKGRSVSTTSTGLADRIKYRKIISPVITVRVEDDILHSPELKFKLNLNSKWNLTNNSIYENFLLKHELTKGLKGKYHNTPNEIKKSLFSPIAILESERQFSVLYAFFRKGMTGESLLNVASLLGFDLANVDAFVKTKTNTEVVIPKRFKIGNYRSALSGPIIFEHRKHDTTKIEDYELRLLYIDREDVIYAFYLFAPTEQKINDLEIENIINGITLYE